MSEMSKVEEVARALKEKIASYDWVYFRDLGATCSIDGDIDMNDVAKAAIEAMRVPTDRMIDMGCAAKVDLYPAYEGEKPQPTAGDVASASYQAMIDAALKE